MTKVLHEKKTNKKNERPSCCYNTLGMSASRRLSALLHLDSLLCFTHRLHYPIPSYPTKPYLFLIIIFILHLSYIYKWKTCLLWYLIMRCGEKQNKKTHNDNIFWCLCDANVTKCNTLATKCYETSLHCVGFKMVYKLPVDYLIWELSCSYFSLIIFQKTYFFHIQKCPIFLLFILRCDIF